MMPQTTMIISQQGFPTTLSASSQQQEQQAAPESPVKKPAVRVTKIRRTRQSRNPQQSVARRNERERNRVKLINKGFDVLRDNLPEEYLKAVAPEKCASLNGDETPDLQSVGGNKKSSSSSSSSKAKKFSKVDTLRAAIQHIRMLEELIRSADPHFELVKIPGAISDEASMLGYDELDTAPLSIGQPASCGSSSSQNSQQQHHSYQMYEQPGEQFVKLEPHIHQQIVPPVAQQQPQQPVETSQFQMMTQVHLDHQRQQLQQQQQQQQMSPNSENPSEQTHLWIQQHQTSFGEQQQQCPTDQQAQAQWYTQTAETFIHQQQQHLVLEQQLSPVSLDSPAGQMQHQHHQQQQQYQQQQQQQVWYAESSPSPQQTAPQQLQQQHLHSAQMGQLSAFSAHQIGLYSQ